VPQPPSVRKAEIEEIAKNYGLRGRSGLNKQELRDLIEASGLSSAVSALHQADARKRKLVLKRSELAEIARRHGIDAPKNESAARLRDRIAASHRDEAAREVIETERARDEADEMEQAENRKMMRLMRKAESLAASRYPRRV
jgi:hypothetical protein